jgi:AI-2 transport protein TqsA
MALAAFITVVSIPPLQWMRRRGVPLPLAVLIIVLVDATIIAAFGLIILESAIELRTVAPEYLARVQEIELQLIRRLQAAGYDISAVSYQEVVNPERLFGLITGTALRITSIMGVTLLVLLYVVFMLAESAALPGKLRQAFGDAVPVSGRLREIVADVQQYLTLKTVISLSTGILVGIAAALIGVDFALFWGFLAFVLNYIPSIGSFFAAVPAILVALLQLGPGSAVMLALVYIAINVVLGSVLDPILVGRSLRLSTFVVLLSLMFWGWVWGIIGMFLAVPLTAAAKIAMENNPSLRTVAILLGPVRERRARGLPPGTPGTPG